MKTKEQRFQDLIDKLMNYFKLHPYIKYEYTLNVWNRFDYINIDEVTTTEEDKIFIQDVEADLAELLRCTLIFESLPWFEKDRLKKNKYPHYYISLHDSVMYFTEYVKDDKYINQYLLLQANDLNEYEEYSRIVCEEEIPWFNSDCYLWTKIFCYNIIGKKHKDVIDFVIGYFIRRKFYKEFKKVKSFPAIIEKYTEEVIKGNQDYINEMKADNFGLIN